MIPGKNGSDTIWNDAFRQALDGRGGQRDGLLLFMEERQDAAVERDDRQELPGIDSSRTFGLSVRGEFHHGRLIHCADPEPDDAARLVRLALDGPSGPALKAAPVGGRPGEPTSSWLPTENADC